MGDFVLYDGVRTADLVLDACAGEGIARIAKKVCGDLEAVTGAAFAVKRTEAVPGDGAAAGLPAAGSVFAGTLGESPVLDALMADKAPELCGLATKKECYVMRTVPVPGGEILCIAGSDTLGTIYGLFRLSRLCGVSPLIYWGDARPAHRDRLTLPLTAPIVSKEPSVRYRGFFINDEWPAFGGWATDTFGDVNAEAYDRIFELLLRLNGNYLWPAMWNSSFSDDGPGLKSAELAAMYGIYMGTSHHEPLYRAGLEWQRDYASYGTDNTWDFTANGEAITAFWRDGVRRNKDFPGVVTIGMRGENDSKLLSEDAGIGENIAVVKAAIEAQHRVLREETGKDLGEIPRMIAIYKEVEAYFHGDANCEGLKDWDELEDVIFMLTDDNHGNLRTLPDEKLRRHPGGFGMYYHFDYHGAPISYEWTNRTVLAKVWEQMSMAYDWGVDRLWIVNVGDLKGNEYPLCFFMDMAYDMEAWGSGAPNRTREFTAKWMEEQLPGAPAESRVRAARVLDGYSRFNNLRTPETTSADIYHPWRDREGWRIRDELTGLMREAGELLAELPENTRDAYRSMIYYPAMASLATQLFNVEAGLNHEAASRGSLAANDYADAAAEHIRFAERIINEFHSFLGGKWKHMMESAHTGFRSWDDYDWTYPVLHRVTPITGARVMYGFYGDGIHHLGVHWQHPEPLVNTEFLRADTQEIFFTIEPRGAIPFTWTIGMDAEWLAASSAEGRWDPAGAQQVIVKIACDRTKLAAGEQIATGTVRVHFDNGTDSRCPIEIRAAAVPQEAGFTERDGMVVMDAVHFRSCRDGIAGETSGEESPRWRRIEDLGAAGDAMRVFPDTADCTALAEPPALTYEFTMTRDGDYELHFVTAARNPVSLGDRMRLPYAVGDGERRNAEILAPDYFTEWQNPAWSAGVLTGRRSVSVPVHLTAGRNTLTVYGGEPGITLERILITRPGAMEDGSYLGPAETK